MAKIIDGKQIAQNVKEELKIKVKEFFDKYNRQITLAVILVGENPASQVYVKNKIKATEYVGMKSLSFYLPENSTEEQVGVLLTSLGISVGIGLTDFIIRSVKRNSKKKKAQKNKNQNITISTIENDPTFFKWQSPDGSECINFRLEPDDGYGSFCRKVYSGIEDKTIEKVEPIVIIEGVYSNHPIIRNFINRLVYVETTKELQSQRLKQRTKNIAIYNKFINLWIPREEQYFIENNYIIEADIII